MGIITNHLNNPYEATGIQWKITVFFFSWLNCCYVVSYVPESINSLYDTDGHPTFNDGNPEKMGIKTPTFGLMTIPSIIENDRCFFRDSIGFYDHASHEENSHISCPTHCRELAVWSMRRQVCRRVMVTRGMGTGRVNHWRRGARICQIPCFTRWWVFKYIFFWILTSNLLRNDPNLRVFLKWVETKH